MNHSIHILLADDHPLVRVGLRTTLDKETNFVVVGEAASGHEAQRLSKQLKPHVLLLDLNMSDVPALDTVNFIRQHCTETKVIVLTAYDDEVYIRGLITAGVAGYVLKDEAPETVCRAITAVAHGDRWLSASAVESLARANTTKRICNPDITLSKRELQVLEMIADGQNNTVIATRLHLAEQTVRNYVSRLYGKLEVKSRAEAMLWARKLGFGAEAG